MLFLRVPTLMWIKFVTTRMRDGRSLPPKIWIRFARTMSASLIGRSGSSTFRLSTLQCVDVARGLALLFGLGTKALPVWDSKTRWNNLWGDLAVRLTVGSSGRANSPHPSSREGHHSTTQWSSSFLLIID